METKTKWYTKTLWIAVLLFFFFPAGLFLMWKYSNWNKFVKWGISIFFGLVVLGMISGPSKSEPTNTNKEPSATASPTVTIKPTGPTSIPTPTPTPKPTPTPVPTDINGFPMDAEAVTVVNLDKAPSQYNGKKVTFTCNVAGFAKDSSGNATAVNCSDPNDFTSIVQVDTSGFDMTKINQGDTVRFYGLGMGAFTGKNAYGGDVSETLVTAFHLNDLTSGYQE